MVDLANPSRYFKPLFQAASHRNYNMITHFRVSFNVVRGVPLQQGGGTGVGAHRRTGRA